MISTVGRAYLTSNIENDEYSYPKAFSAASLTFAPIQNSAGRRFEKLDIRFVKDNISVLIETKQNFTAADEEQLSAYVEYEKALTGNKIIAILANTINDNVKVWRGVISDGDLMSKETALRTMDEYVDFYTSKINDKEKVMQNTYKLNEMLHRHSIPEKLRSQFVGTCLLALKNGLDYSTPSLTAAQIRTRIKEVLEDLLNSDINKAEKLALLNRNVLGDQYVRQLNIAAFREILKFICRLVKQFKCSYLTEIQTDVLCANSQIGTAVYIRFQETSCLNFHKEMIQKIQEYTSSLGKMRKIMILFTLVKPKECSQDLNSI